MGWRWHADRDCEGFPTAGRFVCIDGWPRYLALRDLADTAALRGPAKGIG